MKNEITISDKKIEKKKKKISKAFLITQEEALEIVYEEWDLIAVLFKSHKKVKVVFSHLMEDIDYSYRIA